MTIAELNLRPLSIAELLDRSIRLYRRHFLTFIGILAVVQIPLSLIGTFATLAAFGPSLERINAGAAGQQLTSEELFTPGYFIGMGTSLLIGILNLLLVQGLATAATARAVSESYLGQPISLLAAYQNIPSLGKVMRTALVGTGYIFLCALWMIVPCVGWLTGPGLIFFVSTCLSLAMPVVVLEGLGARASLRRAWDLARQRFWPVWWFVVVLSLFSLLVVSGPSALISWIIQTTMGSAVNNAASFVTLQTIIETIINLILVSLYTPLQVIAMTLLYFDLRVRQEGLDLSLQAASASGEAPLAAVGQAPVGTRGSLITSTEVTNFFALTLLLIAVYFVFAFLGLGTLGLLGGF